MGLRWFKTFFWLLGFSAVIVVSFLIISDVEKTLMLGPVAAVAPPIPINEDVTQLPPPVQELQSAPRPPVAVVPVPRIIIHDTEYYIEGYPLTAFVEFGERILRFRLAGEVDIGYAQLTILSIMEVFDAAYDVFGDRVFYYFYIVAGPSDILNRRVNYNSAEILCHSAVIYMYFLQSNSYPLPKWLCIGLKNYLIAGSGAVPFSNEDLAVWLNQSEGSPSFGDAWLIPSLGPRAVTYDEISNAAYTLVKRWFQAGELYEFVRLAQTDTRAFAAYFNAYIAELAGSETVSDVHFLYRFGDFKAVTGHGSYIFVCDGYTWALSRVLLFIEYMDAAIEFVSYRFTIGNTENIRVNLYPFGVINVPYAIAEMAEMFGWEAPEVNFVSNDEITLAGTARFGTWAMSHEVTHMLLFRAFPEYHPPTWIVEGMAVLGELLFRDVFTGVRPYRFNVPTLANIDMLARNGNGHILPFFCDEINFGRNSWTYDDAGSFVLYLYNNFGIEALLKMYRSDNYSQFDKAVEIFERELDELIYSWRGFLWPNSEPADWWSR